MIEICQTALQASLMIACVFQGQARHRNGLFSRTCVPAMVVYTTWPHFFGIAHTHRN